MTQADASGTTTYTWDARNRLIALSGPTVSASFAYDAMGRRATKTIRGHDTSFRYDGLDVTLEDGPAGPVSYLRTLAIDEALTRTEGSTSVSHLADALGSTPPLRLSCPSLVHHTCPTPPLTFRVGEICRLF